MTRPKPRTIDLPTPRIREWRLYRGLTQEALAERSRVSKPAIKKLEGDPERRPTPTTLTKLAEALDTAPSALYWSPRIVGNTEGEQ